MKAIILAWWYATRLFPLTENFPKPLLPIADKPIIDYVIDKITELGIDDIYLVTNDKYHNHFVDRSKQADRDGIDITVLNDGTRSNDDRLGALWDIHYSIQEWEIDEDTLVVCGDNLFEFGLREAHALFLEEQKFTTVWYDLKDLEVVKKFGVIAVDDTWEVTAFEEKPELPSSTVASIGVYFYPRYTLPLLKQYLEEGNNADAPWHFPAWLMEHDEVYAVIHEEQWFDIGDFDKLAEAKELYGETNVDIEALRRGEM